MVVWVGHGILQLMSRVVVYNQLIGGPLFGATKFTRLDYHTLSYSLLIPLRSLITSSKAILLISEYI